MPGTTRLAARRHVEDESLLSPERALVFQITHGANLPWILRHGLQCETSGERDPNYVEIGNLDLAEKRRRRRVPVPPGGTLADYVPFHFCPSSLLLEHLKTGRNGIRRRSVAEIVILVSSLPALAKAGVSFVFSDQHPSLVTASFFTSLADLPRLDWELWRTREGDRDLRDPDRSARAAAEALVYRHVPVAALHGVACYGDEKAHLDEMVSRAAVRLDVWQRPEWFL
jgi:hypothetical protein